MGSRRKPASWVRAAAVICSIWAVLHVPANLAFTSYGPALRSPPRSLDLTGGRRGDWNARHGKRVPVVPVAAEPAAQPAAEASPEKPAEDAGYDLKVQSILFVSYFALQSSMSFYMKWLLSKVRVAADLVGVPASFLVTTTQQLVGFAMFLAFVAGSYIVGKPYKPKILTTRKSWLLVLALSLSFTLNIGCNLLSLSLCPLSLTMIIRGCSPLSTAITSKFLMKKQQGLSKGEWGCMFFGVLCASAVVVAQSKGVPAGAGMAFFFGVAISCASLFSASLDFVFKGILGTDVKLNALDTICYMALPVAAMTTVFGAILSKPVPMSWATKFAPTMTDFAVFGKLFAINPAAFRWVLVSGIIAFVYNTFVTFMVVKLSPTTTAFAGNFNKAATILVSLLLLEGSLPPGGRGFVIIAAIFGNIGAFTLYNILKKRRQAASK